MLQTEAEVNSVVNCQWQLRLDLESRMFSYRYKHCRIDSKACKG